MRRFKAELALIKLVSLLLAVELSYNVPLTKSKMSNNPIIITYPADQIEFMRSWESRTTADFIKTQWTCWQWCLGLFAALIASNQWEEIA